MNPIKKQILDALKEQLVKLKLDIWIHKKAVVQTETHLHLCRHNGKQPVTNNFAYVNMLLEAKTMAHEAKKELQEHQILIDSLEEEYTYITNHGFK